MASPAVKKRSAAAGLQGGTRNVGLRKLNCKSSAEPESICQPELCKSFSCQIGAGPCVGAFALAFLFV